MSSYLMESPNFRDMALWEEEQFQEAKSLHGDLPSRYDNASELWIDSTEIKGTLNSLWETYKSRRDERADVINNILSPEKILPTSSRNNMMCDSLKVLATVASTVYAFTEKYPNAWIFATGSTNVRTRLYRMGITNNIEEIKTDFDVYGLTVNTNVWEEFIGGEDYEAFLITKRK